eukprot:TRINITY_DN6866_c0_g1_i1.p1 TRINITY_DN6866_c0_g1~~TRINITY_DN6866_c0_g1_i1.p1  ORF type:complete len:128 (+),score=13.83 TRINITY_DN6866_c0_g1_i1:111-494(+)
MMVFFSSSLLLLVVTATPSEIPSPLIYPQKAAALVSLSTGSKDLTSPLTPGKTTESPMTVHRSSTHAVIREIAGHKGDSLARTMLTVYAGLTALAILVYIVWGDSSSQTRAKRLRPEMGLPPGYTAC